MRRLHEVWEAEDEDGWMVMICYAGEHGDQNRRLLPPSAKLIRTFEAGSHFEAMTIHNRLMGWEEYKIEPEFEALVKAPYPDDWSDLL